MSVTTHSLLTLPINLNEPDNLNYWQAVKARELSTSPLLRDRPLLNHATKMINKLKYGVK